MITDLAESEISDAEFEKEKELLKDVEISSKEELYYLRIFKSFFNTDGEVEAIGRWKGGFSSEDADL